MQMTPTALPRGLQEDSGLSISWSMVGCCMEEQGAQKNNPDTLEQAL